MSHNSRTLFYVLPPVRIGFKHIGSQLVVGGSTDPSSSRLNQLHFVFQDNFTSWKNNLSLIWDNEHFMLDGI